MGCDAPYSRPGREDWGEDPREFVDRSTDDYLAWRWVADARTTIMSERVRCHALYGTPTFSSSRYRVLLGPPQRSSGRPGIPGRSPGPTHPIPMMGATCLRIILSSGARRLAPREGDIPLGRVGAGFR